ncbi:MAG: hypothetical protein OEY06_01370 [Gammaproteobacteria bacterium]|nr:hypothetical protein [Gammaproteobacteria bacterium]
MEAEVIRLSLLRIRVNIPAEFSCLSDAVAQLNWKTSSLVPEKKIEKHSL